MKKLLLCGVLAAGCCLTSPAQSKINNVGRVELSQFKLQKEELAKSSPARAAAYNPSVSVFVVVKPGVTAADLEDAGYNVLNSADDIHIVNLPMSQVEELAALDIVKYLDFGYKAKAKMDVARAASGVDDCHTGNGLDKSYKGSGVYVGLYDTGLDPSHIAFTDSNNKTRVKGIYLGRSGSISSYTTDDQIASFTSDARTESHGTHVLGIITGRDDIEGEFGVKKGTTTSNTTGTIPYYGVAPDADILVGCGDFDTSSINAGVGAIVDRAESENRPVVINLSLGHNRGAHDSRESSNAFLDQKSKNAIICVSSGNEGGGQLSVQKTFRGSGAGARLNTFVVPTSSATDASYYTAEFWSDTDYKFDCTLVLYNTSSKEIVASLPLTGDRGSKTWKTTDNDYFASAYAEGSQVSVSWGVDNATGRYNVYMANQMTATGNVPILFGINISGEAGNTVNGYCDAISGAEVKFSQEGVSGYVTGNDVGSINGMACGEKVIAVGAWVSRTSMPTLGNSSTTYTSSGSVGTIASFSSYGAAYGPSGKRQLPLVCAPGSQIISSVSHYWVENQSMAKTSLNAYSNGNNRDNQYYYMQGTSMSCPFVTGSIALWLEACPSLRVAEVQQILAETSTTDSNTTPSDKWGAGKINVLAGLKKAIDMNASVKSILADNADENLIVVSNGSKQYEVSCVGVNNLSCTLYNLQGAAVATAASNGDTINLDASAVQDGIYVLSVNAAGQKLARKLVVK
jgi:hypothetical protein